MSGNRISRHRLRGQSRCEDWHYPRCSLRPRLTREIKAAEIARIPLSSTIAADLFRSGKANIFGADSGVGYPAAEALTGAKIVPGAFGTVLVAATLPKGRSPAAQALLATLIDEAKETGGAASHRREEPQGRERRHKIAEHGEDLVKTACGGARPLQREQGKES